MFSQAWELSSFKAWQSPTDYSLLLSQCCTVSHGETLGPEMQTKSFCSRKVGVYRWAKTDWRELIHFGAACKDLWSLSEPPNVDNSISHNFLTLQNGLQMHYLSTADASQSTDSLIILLHGFPDSCYIWQQQLHSNLAQKAKLIALDLPGCGGSDSHSRYGPDEILNAVAEAIVQLKDCYLGTSSRSSSPPKSILVSHDWYVSKFFTNSECS